MPCGLRLWSSSIYEAFIHVLGIYFIRRTRRDPDSFRSIQSIHLLLYTNISAQDGFERRSHPAAVKPRVCPIPKPKECRPQHGRNRRVYATIGSKMRSQGIATRRKCSCKSANMISKTQTNISPGCRSGSWYVTPPPTCQHHLTTSQPPAST